MFYVQRLHARKVDQTSHNRKQPLVIWFLFLNELIFIFNFRTNRPFQVPGKHLLTASVRMFSLFLIFLLNSI